MKRPAVLRLWAVLCTVIILSACQKETSQTSKQEISTEEIAGVHTTGALPDDPARIAKVPTIMSREFLSNTQKYMTTPDMLSARGKPVKSGTDVTPPSVSITSPTNGSTVSGTVSIQVSATDNVAVASVSLTVDGTTIGTSSTAPYSFSWTASSGTHTIVATAKDAAGNSATNSISVSQNVVSADVTAPAVSITSPASGSSVSGTVSVSVNASDNVGVKSVTLSVDGTIVSTLTATPYNFSWNTTNVADGNHSVSAKATDAAGNTNTSTITVAKNTTITTLPSGSLPSTVSLIMPPVSNQGAEGCCIAFAAGYYARSCEQYYHTNATSYNNTTNIFSPEYLFNQTKSSLDCNGSSVINTLDFLVNNGICSWQSMPYTSGSCNLLPTTTQNSEASTYKIKSYSTIFTSDLIAIKTLLSQKHPLLLGISTDQQFDNAGPGFIWSSYGSATTSLHEVTICGYDDSKQAFRIVNSWGANWGDSGYSWISYNFLPMLNNYVFAMNL
jgi:hypothetical protein